MSARPALALLADLLGSAPAQRVDGAPEPPRELRRPHTSAAANDTAPPIGFVAPACARCARCTRRRTCSEPEAAGLVQRFGLAWVDLLPADHARDCRAFSAAGYAPPEAVERPYRLAPADADRCHARPWDERACARFAARVSGFLRVGLAGVDADDLAERLHLRDLDRDDRRTCLECAVLVPMGPAGWRCGASARAGVAHALPLELVGALQRCAGFRPRSDRADAAD
ncbi:MAG: hypothetical protein L6Q68_03310 [Aquabacterium sp.]|nr:hypothetical protein [Aquabacterium sp.]